MDIISRKEWGAPLWESMPKFSNRRDGFVVHWHGGPPVYDTGRQFPLSVDRMHRERGYLGIGYNFAVDRRGIIYEGRGWDGVGAHCLNHNERKIGVIVACGEGGPLATDAALASVAALYEEACRRFGRIKAYGHSALYPTVCPGPQLLKWVDAGMPVKTPVKLGADMALTDAEIERVANLTRDKILGATYGRKADGNLTTLSNVLGEMRVGIAAMRDQLDAVLHIIDTQAAGRTPGDSE